MLWKDGFWALAVEHETSDPRIGLDPCVDPLGEKGFPQIKNLAAYRHESRKAFNLGRGKA